ncbi:hypothetical protein TorRG33x02_199090, partial [Trema orientale]
MLGTTTECQRARIMLRGLARDYYQATTGSRRFRRQVYETAYAWLRMGQIPYVH